MLIMKNVITNMNVNLSQENLNVNSSINTFQHALKIKRNRKRLMFIIKSNVIHIIRIMFIIKKNVIHIQNRVMEALNIKIMIILIIILILIMMELIYLMRAMKVMKVISSMTITTK